MTIHLHNLDKNALFKGKSKSDIEALIKKGQGLVKKYKTGEIIFHMGDPAFHVAIIVLGDLVARRYLANGKPVVIQFKGSGDFFGESSFYEKSKNWSCDVVARNKCTLILFEKNRFLDIVQSDKVLIRNFFQAFSNKIFDLEFKAELMSYKSIQQKISFFVTYFTSIDNYCFDLPFSKKELAEYMNVSRTSLSRELKKMTESGILCNKGRRICVKDMDKMYDLLIK